MFTNKYHLNLLLKTEFNTKLSPIKHITILDRTNHKPCEGTIGLRGGHHSHFQHNFHHQGGFPHRKKNILDPFAKFLSHFSNHWKGSRRSKDVDNLAQWAAEKFKDKSAQRWREVVDGSWKYWTVPRLITLLTDKVKDGMSNKRANGGLTFAQKRIDDSSSLSKWMNEMAGHMKSASQKLKDTMAGEWKEWPVTKWASGVMNQWKQNSQKFTNEFSADFSKWANSLNEQWKQKDINGGDWSVSKVMNSMSDSFKSSPFAKWMSGHSGDQSAQKRMEGISTNGAIVARMMDALTKGGYTQTPKDMYLAKLLKNLAENRQKQKQESLAKLIKSIIAIRQKEKEDSLVKQINIIQQYKKQDALKKLVIASREKQKEEHLKRLISASQQKQKREYLIKLMNTLALIKQKQKEEYLKKLINILTSSRQKQKNTSLVKNVLAQMSNSNWKSGGLTVSGQNNPNIPSKVLLNLLIRAYANKALSNSGFSPYKVSNNAWSQQPKPPKVNSENVKAYLILLAFINLLTQRQNHVHSCNGQGNGWSEKKVQGESINGNVNKGFGWDNLVETFLKTHGEYLEKGHGGKPNEHVHGENHGKEHVHGEGHEFGHHHREEEHQHGANHQHGKKYPHKEEHQHGANHQYGKEYPHTGHQHGEGHQHEKGHQHGEGHQHGKINKYGKENEQVGELEDTNPKTGITELTEKQWKEQNQDMKPIQDGEWKDFGQQPKGIAENWKEPEQNKGEGLEWDHDREDVGEKIDDAPKKDYTTLSDFDSDSDSDESSDEEVIVLDSPDLEESKGRLTVVSKNVTSQENVALIKSESNSEPKLGLNNAKKGKSPKAEDDEGESRIAANENKEEEKSIPCKLVISQLRQLSRDVQFIKQSLLPARFQLKNNGNDDMIQARIGISSKEDKLEGQHASDEDDFVQTRFPVEPDEKKPKSRKKKSIDFEENVSDGNYNSPKNDELFTRFVRESSTLGKTSENTGYLYPLEKRLLSFMTGRSKNAEEKAVSMEEARFLSGEITRSNEAGTQEHDPENRYYYSDGRPDHSQGREKIYTNEAQVPVFAEDTSSK